MAAAAAAAAAAASADDEKGSTGPSKPESGSVVSTMSVDPSAVVLRFGPDNPNVTFDKAAIVEFLTVVKLFAENVPLEEFGNDAQNVVMHFPSALKKFAGAAEKDEAVGSDVDEAAKRVLDVLGEFTALELRAAREVILSRERPSTGDVAKLLWDVFRADTCDDIKTFIKCRNNSSVDPAPGEKKPFAGALVLLAYLRGEMTKTAAPRYVTPLDLHNNNLLPRHRQLLLTRTLLRIACIFTHPVLREHVLLSFEKVANAEIALAKMMPYSDRRAGADAQPLVYVSPKEGSFADVMGDPVKAQAHINRAALGPWRVSPATALSRVPSAASVLEAIKTRALGAYAPRIPEMIVATAVSGSGADSTGMDVAMRNALASSAQSNRELVAHRLRQYRAKCDGVLIDMSVASQIERATDALRAKVKRVVELSKVEYDRHVQNVAFKQRDFKAAKEANDESARILREAEAVKGAVSEKKEREEDVDEEEEDDASVSGLGAASGGAAPDPVASAALDARITGAKHHAKTTKEKLDEATNALAYARARLDEFMKPESGFNRATELLRAEQKREDEEKAKSKSVAVEKAAVLSAVVVEEKGPFEVYNETIATLVGKIKQTLRAWLEEQRFQPLSNGASRVGDDEMVDLDPKAAPWVRAFA